MTYINANIQDGFLRRRGFRGRFLTAYWHRYAGKEEVSGRSHAHPWRFSFGVVLSGGFEEEIVYFPKNRRKLRRFLSVSFYFPITFHRLLSVKKNTHTLFFGFFRHQSASPPAMVSCPEGYCHYSELYGDVSVRS